VQNLQINPQILNVPGKRPANRNGMVRPMAKIIPVSFTRGRLPRALLRDGWWLETPPTRTPVAPFAGPQANLNTPHPAKPSPKAPHLTLVHSGK